MLVPTTLASRPRTVAVVAAALALLLGASVLRAQDTATRRFTALYLLGSDTLATEQLSLSGTAMTGDLRMRGQPRLRWTQHLDDPAGTRTLDLQAWPPNAAESAAPAQHLRLQVRGDSAYIYPFAPSGTAATTPQAVLPAHVGASWIVNQSVVHAGWLAQASANVDTAWVMLSSGARLLPAAVTTRGDTATLTIGGVQSRFVFANDQLQSASVPAQRITVQLLTGDAAGAAAAAVAAPPSYDAPADAPYTAANVTVPTSMGHTLAGTLTLPTSAVLAGGRHPVAITISGSGPQERDERLAGVQGYALFRQIADTLGRRGIAVLRLDDRGVGGSGGNFAAATSRDFANDVQAAVTWLRSRSDIDPARIALVGHSEGGLIAPWVAEEDSTLAAIVLLAGPAYTGARIIAFQQQTAIAETVPDASPAVSDSLFRDAQRQLTNMARSNPWTAAFLTHDPLPIARRVRAPVLVLQGDTDQQITPEQADTLAAAFRAGGNPDVTMRRLPDTNHLFLRDASGAVSGYPSLPDRQATAESMGLLADWLAARLLR